LQYADGPSVAGGDGKTPFPRFWIEHPRIPAKARSRPRCAKRSSVILLHPDFTRHPAMRASSAATQRAKYGGHAVKTRPPSTCTWLKCRAITLHQAPPPTCRRNRPPVCTMWRRPYPA
jgi:hypothetical protein